MAIRYLSGINVDSNTLFVDDANNRVGIGTDSPSSPGLGTSSPAILNIYKASGNSGVTLTVGSNAWDIGNVNGTGLWFIYNNSTKAVITNAGNVGIGTTSPLFKLHVVGTSGGDSTFNQGILIENNNATDGEPTLAFKVNSMSAGTYWMTGLNQSANYKIAYGTGFTDANTLFTILNGGNVGIGYTNPSFKLDINGDMRLNGEFNLVDGNVTLRRVSDGLRLMTNNLDRLVVDSSGNVGIGTASPATKLHIVGSSSDTAGTGLLRIEGGGGGGNVSWTFRSTVTNNDLTLDRQYAGAYYQALTFQRSTGNVGIGTTNPTTPLHVYGIAQIVESGNTAFYGGNYVRMFGDQSYSFRNTGGSIRGIINTTSGNFSLYNSSSVLVNQIATAGNSYFNGGNVGIGTTSPDTRLEVRTDSGATASNSKFRVTAGAAGAYGGTAHFEGAYNDYGNVAQPNIVGKIEMASEVITVTDVGGTMKFFTKATGGTYATAPIERMRITSAGNVGIGTTSPAAKLHVYETTAGIGGVLVGNASNSNSAYSAVTLKSDYPHSYYPGLFLNSSTNTAYAGVDQLMLYQFHSKPIALVTNNTVRLTVTGSGDVGIGTTSPSTKLHVVGDIRSAALQVYDGLGAGVTGVGAASSGGALRLYSNGSVGITLNTSGAVQLNDYGSGSNTGTATQRLAVDASGNVIEIPIGSGPVDGTGTANYVTKWSDADTITNSQIFDNGTSVGIGTASPATKLHVPDGEISTEVFSFSAINGITPVNTVYLAAPRDGNASIFTASTERLTVDASGNVGIGDTTPSYRLDVSGDARVTSHLYSNASMRAPIFYDIDDVNYYVNPAGATSAILAGNVGIGTTSPSGKLDVIGDSSSHVAKFSNLTTTGYAPGSILLEAGQSEARGQGVYHYNPVADESWFTGVPYNVVSRKWIVANKPDTAWNPDVAQLSYALMTIDSDTGNVGIGTNSPGQKLHVVGDARIEGNLTINGTVTQIDTDTLTTEQWLVTNDGTGPAVVINQKGTQPVIDIQDDGVSSFYIADGGNVGIGTTTPGKTLDITGEIRTSGRATFNEYVNTSLVYGNTDLNLGYAGGTTGILINSSGNVGIGTAVPAQKLHVYGKLKLEDATGGTVLSGSYGYFKVSPTNNYGVLVENSADAAKYFSFGVPGDYGQIRYKENTGTAISVNATGVGIGTTSPNHLLDVEAAGASARIYNLTSDGNTDFYLSTVGTIGLSRLLFGDTANSAIGKIIYRNNGDSMAFETNAAEAMRITSAGNVGIGTTSPAHKLDISGDLNVNHTANVVAIRVGGIAAIGRGLNTDGTRINGGSTDGIEFTPNNDATIKVVIKPTGNVGIGTTSPGGKLTVVSDNAYSNGNGLRLQSSSGADRTLLYFSTDHTNQVSTIQSYRDGTGGGVKNLLINPQGGNVGIGTTSPGHRLDVGGSININNISYAYKINDLNVLSVSAAYTNLHHPEGGIAIYLGDSADRTNYYDNSAHRFRNAGGGSDYVFINSSGNVGIGTTSPTHKLHVAGSVNIEDDLTFGIGGFLGTSTSVFEMYSLGDIIYNADSNNNGDSSHIFRESGNELMRITSAGNVGIGTSSPDYKLNIVDNQASDYVGLFIANSRAYGTGQGAYGSSIWLGKEENGGNQPMGAITARPNSESNSTEGHMTFSTRASSVLNEHMRITNTGNVGIGTTSPTSGYKLDVIGAIRIENVNGLYIDAAYAYGDNSGGGISIYNRGTTRALRVLSSSGTGWGDILLNPYGAKVGIGTLDPTQALHVSGNIRVTGAYYDSNNSAGTSGQILKSTGTGTDWVTLSEITGVDGTGTANYIAKWSDTDTIANSQIRDDGTTVGIGVAPGDAKLYVGGSIEAGGKITYKKAYSSGVDTTGVAVAGLPSSYNGDSTLFEFTCSGGAGHYQKIVYSCWNAATVWYTKKVVDEGTNAFDVEASADAATITFTFKSRSGLQQYTPKIVVEANGTYDTSYL